MSPAALLWNESTDFYHMHCHHQNAPDNSIAMLRYWSLERYHDDRNRPGIECDDSAKILHCANFNNKIALCKDIGSVNVGYIDRHVRRHRVVCNNKQPKIFSLFLDIQPNLPLHFHREESEFLSNK